MAVKNNHCKTLCVCVGGVFVHAHVLLGKEPWGLMNTKQAPHCFVTLPTKTNSTSTSGKIRQVEKPAPKRYASRVSWISSLCLCFLEHWHIHNKHAEDRTLLYIQILLTEHVTLCAKPEGNFSQ